jgi:hypothetical protein
MGYEIFEKVYPSKSLAPTMTISPLGRCSLNRAAAEMLNKDAVESVLLLWDKSNRKFALKPARNDARSFPIRYSKKRKGESVVVGAAFSGVMFLKHIGYDFTKTGTYPIARNDAGTMYEAELPAERFGAQAPQPPVWGALEGGKKHVKAV